MIYCKPEVCTRYTGYQLPIPDCGKKKKKNEIHFAPPKKAYDDCHVHTNKPYGFPRFLRWCRTWSIQVQSNRGEFLQPATSEAANTCPFPSCDISRPSLVIQHVLQSFAGFRVQLGNRRFLVHQTCFGPFPSQHHSIPVNIGTLPHGFPAGFTLNQPKGYFETYH